MSSWPPLLLARFIARLGVRTAVIPPAFGKMARHGAITMGVNASSMSYRKRLSSACKGVFLLILVVIVVSAPAALGGQSAPASQPGNRPARELAPAPDPAQLEARYRERVARNPNDLEALRGVAATEIRHRNFPAAIQGYRRVLELDPNDRAAQVGLARALSLAGRYDASLEVYHELLRTRPEDTDALEGLARIYLWSGRPSDALPILRALATRYPSNPEYRVAWAGAEARLKHYRKARELLAAVLSSHHQNREARLQLAYVDVFQGRYRNALRQFNALVKVDPTDFDALLGNARIHYYQGDLTYAHRLVLSLVAERPEDFEALFLLASIERALHNRREARAVLARTDRVNTSNPEAQELAARLHDDSRVTLHTAASFARELGSGNAFGSEPGSANEDLRAFGYESTVRFPVLRRSDSFLSSYYYPSNSPSGGIRGAAGPVQILYRQNTYLFPRLALHGGAGLVRFGPGELESVPSQTEPIPTGGVRPLGFASVTYALRSKLTIDLTAARSPITYTPLAVRLGVMENRWTGALNYSFTPRTELHLEAFQARASSVRYDHVSIVNGTTRVVQNKADRDRGRGGSLTFDRNLYRSDRLSFHLGYSGLAYGYAGHRRGLFMGFFNPGFYQRHYLTTRFNGKLWGPVGYDFSGSIGTQQIEHGAALTRALLLSPALSFKVSHRLSLTLGYMHYNNAQSLGTVRGNAVRLSTDWKF